MTFNTLTDSVTLPWKFKAAAQATYPSFRIMSAGTIVAMVLVLAATLVILVSLYRIRSFLLGLNEDAEQTFQGFSKRKRWCKMLKRITVACLASLATLAISYVPMTSAILMWGNLGKQSSDANAVAHVFCSVAHTINPIIAITMSAKVQRAFVSFLKLVKPFKPLLKSYPSIEGGPTSLDNENNYFYYVGAKERMRMLEKNFHDEQFPWRKVSSYSSKGTENEVFLTKTETCVHGEKNVQLISHLTGVKRPLAARLSTPIGTRLHRYHTLFTKQRKLSL